MIVLLKGGFDPPRTRRVWLQVREDVLPPQAGRTIQARKDGYYELEMETVLRPVLGKEGCPTGEEELITQWSGRDTKIAPLVVWVSPLLGDLTIDDFPDNFAFGNGITGPLDVEVTRGAVTEVRPVTRVVFPLGTALTPVQLLRLQEIFEGIPPGSLERNVFQPFNAEGRLDGR